MGGKILSSQEIQDTIPNVWKTWKLSYEDFLLEETKAAHLWKVGGEGTLEVWYYVGWIDDLIKLEEAFNLRLKEKYTHSPTVLLPHFRVGNRRPSPVSDVCGHCGRVSGKEEPPIEGGDECLDTRPFPEHPRGWSQASEHAIHRIGRCPRQDQRCAGSQSHRVHCREKRLEPMTKVS